MKTRKMFRERIKELENLLFRSSSIIDAFKAQLTMASNALEQLGEPVPGPDGRLRSLEARVQALQAKHEAKMAALEKAREETKAEVPG